MSLFGRNSKRRRPRRNDPQPDFSKLSGQPSSPSPSGSPAQPPGPDAFLENLSRAGNKGAGGPREESFRQKSQDACDACSARTRRVLAAGFRDAPRRAVIVAIIAGFRPQRININSERLQIPERAINAFVCDSPPEVKGFGEAFGRRRAQTSARPNPMAQAIDDRPDPPLFSRIPEMINALWTFAVDDGGRAWRLCTDCHQSLARFVQTFPGDRDLLCARRANACLGRVLGTRGLASSHLHHWPALAVPFVQEATALLAHSLAPQLVQLSRQLQPVVSYCFQRTVSPHTEQDKTYRGLLLELSNKAYQFIEAEKGRPQAVFLDADRIDLKQQASARPSASQSSDDVDHTSDLALQILRQCHASATLPISQVVSVSRAVYRQLCLYDQDVANQFAGSAQFSLACSGCRTDFSARYQATLMGDGDTMGAAREIFGKNIVTIGTSGIGDEAAARKGICPKCNGGFTVMTVCLGPAGGPG